MAGIGKTDVHVFLRPRVGIISSGDEIVPIESPIPGEVRDINRYTIVSMVKETGGIPLFLGIAKDRFDDLKEKIELGLRESDMVVITGGSSVGTLDLTREVLQSSLGQRSSAMEFPSGPGNQPFLQILMENLFLVYQDTLSLPWSSSISLVNPSLKSYQVYPEKKSCTR